MTCRRSEQTGTHATVRSYRPHYVTSVSWPTSSNNLTKKNTQKKNRQTVGVSAQSPAGYRVWPLGPIVMRSRGGGPLECPGPRMWQLLPSWDAVPQRCFPGYQVRGKPPMALLKWNAGSKPLATYHASLPP